MPTEGWQLQESYKLKNILFLATQTEQDHRLVGGQPLGGAVPGNLFHLAYQGQGYTGIRDAPLVVLGAQKPIGRKVCRILESGKGRRVTATMISELAVDLANQVEKVLATPMAERGSEEME